MKLEIKNLHNDTFTVECDSDITVRVLKDKIVEKKDLAEKYSWDPEYIKLLHKGKVMDDDETVEHYDIQPDQFLVLVKQSQDRPKPKPKKKPNQDFNNFMGGFNSPHGMSHMPNSFMQQPFSSNSLMQQPFSSNSLMQQPFSSNTFPQQPFSSSNTFPQQSFPSNTFSQQQKHTPVVPDTSDTTPESFSTAEEREEALQNLLVMGFDRSDCEKALRASFYNVETAVEYLTSGNIPTIDTTPTVLPATGLGQPSSGILNPPRGRSSPTIDHNPTGGDVSTNIRQMRQLLQQNPEQLQLLKNTLKDEHPEIANMIDEDPQAFLNLLNQAGNADNDDNQAPTGANNTPGTGGQGGTITVSLSSQEQQTINRLQEMGFDRNRAIEAFLTCDRNEELAINYLLNSFD